MFVEIIIDGHPCTINLQYALEIFFDSLTNIITITHHGPIQRKYEFETTEEAEDAYHKILYKLQNRGVM